MTNHLHNVYRMKEKLSKYRMMYQERYKQLLERIEKDGEEVGTVKKIYPLNSPFLTKDYEPVQ